MPRLVSKKDLAHQKGVSFEAICMAVKRGELKYHSNKLIDLDDELTKIYLLKQSKGYTDKKAIRLLQKQKEKRERLEKKVEERSNEIMNFGDENNSFDDIEFDDRTLALLPLVKAQEDIRYRKAQSNIKTLEFATKLNILFDQESLTKKFSPFINFLVTSLITAPENLAPVLYSVSATSDDPEKAIQDELISFFENIIREAKQASLSIIPPKNSIRYIFDEDID